MYHPLWLTGVGHWYLPINKELPSSWREYDGKELPAELTRTGKLRFADEFNIGRSGIQDRRRRRLYHQRYLISMDLTLPFGRWKKRNERDVEAGINDRKKIRPALLTYTLFEYLHYIEEPSDISFQYNLSSFHCLFAVGMPNIATQSGVSLYMILVPMHTYSTRVQQRDQTHSEAAAALVTAAAATAASGRVAVVVPTYTVVVVVRRIVEVRVVLLHHQP